VRQACHTFRRCKFSAGRGDRNRPSRQGCPSRGGIRRKPTTTTRTRRTGTGYKASAVWAIQQWLEKPDSHPDAARVDPAGPERRTCDLPWEICLPAEAPRASPPRAEATMSATAWEERTEVSRGRSSSSRTINAGDDSLTRVMGTRAAERRAESSHPRSRSEGLDAGEATAKDDHLGDA
jgi:hypothetical protein